MTDTAQNAAGLRLETGTNDRKNFARVMDGYVVRTQAGFKQAVKSFSDDEKYEFEDGSQFPTSYPSFCQFSLYYRGALRLYVRSRHVNDEISFLEKKIEELKKQ